MSGTKTGGAKASKTIKQKYGVDHYIKIGALGGRKSRGGGFSSMPREKIVEAGRKGGAMGGKRREKQNV